MNGNSIKQWFKSCPYKNKNCRKMHFIHGCSLCKECFEESVDQEITSGQIKGAGE